MCRFIVTFLATALVTMYLTYLSLTVRKNLRRGNSGETVGSSCSSVLMLWCVCVAKKMPSCFLVKWKVSGCIVNYTVRLHTCRFVDNEDLLISVINLIWLMQNNTTLRHVPLFYIRRKIQHFIEKISGFTSCVESISILLGFTGERFSANVCKGHRIQE